MAGLAKGLGSACERLLAACLGQAVAAFQAVLTWVPYRCFGLVAGKVKGWGLGTWVWALETSLAREMHVLTLASARDWILLQGLQTWALMQGWLEAGRVQVLVRAWGCCIWDPGSPHSRLVRQMRS